MFIPIKTGDGLRRCSELCGPSIRWICSALRNKGWNRMHVNITTTRVSRFWLNNTWNFDCWSSQTLMLQESKPSVIVNECTVLWPNRVRMSETLPGSSTPPIISVDLQQFIKTYRYHKNVSLYINFLDEVD